MIRGLIIVLCWAFAGNSLAHGDLGERIAALSARLEIAPREAALYATRGDLHRQHGDWTAALDDYAMARQLDPAVNDLDYREGRAMLDSGAPDRARSLFDRHLADRPDDARALIQRSRAHAAVGAWLDAAEDLGRVQTILANPAPDIFIERTRALLEAGPGHRSAAFANLAQGVERLGPIVTLVRFAVTAARERGLHADAIAWLDRLPSALKKQPLWLAEKGDILTALNRHDDAARCYVQALAAIDARPPTRRDVPAMRALRMRVTDTLTAAQLAAVGF